MTKQRRRQRRQQQRQLLTCVMHVRDKPYSHMGAIFILFNFQGNKHKEKEQAAHKIRFHRPKRCTKTITFFPGALCVNMKCLCVCLYVLVCAYALCLTEKELFMLAR